MKRNRKNDLKSDNLKGNIKSIETIKQNFVEKNDQLILDQSYGQDKNTFATYYKNGSQINELAYDSLNRMTFKLIWQYDTEGNKVGNKVYCYDGSLISESSFHLTENGNIVEKINDGIIIYKYNSKGYAIEEFWYELDWQLQFKYTYKYDNCGNEIEWIHHDDLMLSKITYQYDDTGNVIKEGSYDANGCLYEENIYDYSFDSNGNRIIKIEKITKDMLLVSKTITNRAIKYQ